MTQAHERTATLSELVAEEIRALMARRRASGRDLAGKLGVSPSWISYRLSGKQPIDVNDLMLIARALGVEVHELLPPPEIAKGAADPRTTHRYADVSDKSPMHMPRQRGNRPPGHPSGSTTPGVARTAYVDRRGRGDGR